jgi:hypothetical protein
MKHMLQLFTLVAVALALAHGQMLFARPARNAQSATTPVTRNSKCHPRRKLRRTTTHPEQRSV